MGVINLAAKRKEKRQTSIPFLGTKEQHIEWLYMKPILSLTKTIIRKKSHGFSSISGVMPSGHWWRNFVVRKYKSSSLEDIFHVINKK